MARRISASDNLAGLKRAFRRVPAAFRPVPQWWWNGDPTRKSDVRAQIMKMKAQGMGGVMPIGYYGLDLPFAGKAWYSMIRYAAEVCAEQKMDLWLYDEFHCSSGTCAGRVLQEHPEYNCVSLVHNAYRLSRGETLKVDLRPSWMRYPENAHAGQEIFADEPVRLFYEAGGRYCSMEDYELECRQRPAAEGRPGNVNCLVWKNRTGKAVVLHVFSLAAAHSVMPSSFGTRWATHQPGYIDVMNPRAVRAFLTRVFDGYDRVLKDYYGTVVPGMYTDEPGLVGGLHSKAGSVLPYTPALSALFRKTYGYDLGDRLVELASDTGGFRQTRPDYWRLVSELFNENFNGQYARWCERRGLLYTGHFLREETLRGAARANGDLHNAVSRMHIPGIDLLGQKTIYNKKSSRSAGTEGNPNHVIAVKMVVSAAHAAGAPRVISETNGVSKWSVTLGEFKHMADWIGGMGISFFNDNGAFFSLKGFSLRSGRSFSSPWWPYYRHYADYVARLSLLAAAGRPDVATAVLYPVTATWAAMNAADNPGAAESESARCLKTMQVVLQAVSECLLRDHCEYDFLFENSLKTSAVRAGCVAVRDYRYNCVILPAVDVLSEVNYQALLRLLDSGGKVIAVGHPPRWTTGSSGLRRLSAAGWRRAGMVCVPGIVRDPHLRVLRNMFACQPPAPLIPRGDGLENVQVARRVLRDGQAVFLVNHDDAPVEFSLDTPPSSGEIWNIETGDISPLKNLPGTPLPISLAPHESRLMVFGVKRGRVRSIPRPPRTHSFALPDIWSFFPRNDNLLLLAPEIAFDFGDFGLARGWYKNEEAASWEKLQSDAARLVLSPNIMRAYWLRAAVRVDALPRTLVLFHDGETPCRVFVNGREASALPRRILWDDANLCFNLRPLIRRGINRIVLRVPPSPYLADAIVRGSARSFHGQSPAPAVLAGDFVATASNRIRAWRLPCILRNGSWVAQGFPFFAGRGCYTQTLQLAKIPGRTCLELSKMRDVAEVVVNNKLCAVRAWSPYTVDITEALRRGDNRIAITVINTFGNLLRRHYFGYDMSVAPAGLLGKCRLLMERYL